jgi:peptidoglycan/LPS O-acetylase OafA/YrhL
LVHRTQAIVAKRALTPCPVYRFITNKIIIMTASGNKLQTKQPTPKSDNQRMFGLDTLRFVAILLVLGRHVEIAPPGNTVLITDAIHFWRTIGWIGVDLFFILSGFLISNLLVSEYQKNGTIRTKRFLYRRALKILPSLYVLLIFTFFISRSPLNPSFLLSEIFLVQNYFQGLWAHTWTLAIEGHFYIAITLIMSLLIALNCFTLFPVIAGFIIIICSISRIAFALGVRIGDFHECTVLTRFRLDSLFIGALTGFYWVTKRELLEIFGRKYSRYRYPLFAGTIVLPACFPLETSNVMYSYGYNISAFSFAGILIITLSQPSNLGIRSQGHISNLGKLIEHLGKHSYPTYLWHMPVYSVCSKFKDRISARCLHWFTLVPWGNSILRICIIPCRLHYEQSN